MKITREEFQKTGEESPQELFHHGIKAKETREKYTSTLRYMLYKIFEEILDRSFEQQIKQFVKYAKEEPD